MALFLNHRALRYCKNIDPMSQVYAVVGLSLFFQYTLNSLAYLELFPDIAGKSLNGITKNSTYLIPGMMALLCSFFFEGKKGVFRVIRPYFIIPLNPLWWLFAAICLVPVLYLSLLLNDILYSYPIKLYPMNLPDYETIKRFSPSFIKVAISDEMLWIGFVLPRLLHEGYSPL
jgi:hypothetical protein